MPAFNAPGMIKAMVFTIRPATRADLPLLLPLIEAATTELLRPFLTPAQVASSRAIMGLDTQLIDDGTYYAVLDGPSSAPGDPSFAGGDPTSAGGDAIVGCGGWSRRATLYGGDHSAGRDAALLDPATEPARIRAMYTSPAFTRRGVGRLILTHCEQAAATEGFTTLSLMSTLAGQPLYEAAGYRPTEHLTDATGGTPVPLVRMSKSLSPR